MVLDLSFRTLMRARDVCMIVCVCMSGMHMPNLVSVHPDVHANCKTKIMYHGVCMHIPALRFYM